MTKETNKLAVVENLERLVDETDDLNARGIITEFLDVLEDWTETSNQLLDAAKGYLNMPAESTKDLLRTSVLDCDRFLEDEA